jgi:threonine/homoserine/homoserine lactone efflux protein
VLTVRNTLLGGGRRHGVFTAVGIAAGQTVWVFATSFGLAALVARSEPAFMTLRVFGTAYLVYLGAQALLAASASTLRTQSSWRKRGTENTTPCVDAQH